MWLQSLRHHHDLYKCIPVCHIFHLSFSVLFCFRTWNYIYYKGVSCVRALLPCVSLQSNRAWKPSRLGLSISFSLWWFSSLITLWSRQLLRLASLQSFLWFFCCYLPARLLRNFNFKLERFGKWSDIAQIGRGPGTFSLAPCFYSDKTRSSSEWQCALYSKFTINLCL